MPTNGSRGEERAMIWSIADAKRRFSELVKRAAYKGETIAIGARSKPEAALISVEELQRLHDLDMANDARLLEQAVRASRGTVGLDAVLKAWRRGHPQGTFIGSEPPLPAAARRKVAGGRRATARRVRKARRPTR